MRTGLAIGLFVSALLVTAAFALSGPSRLFPTDSSTGSGIPFECEDLVDGDRVEIRNETSEERIEIRVEADTRVRAEARFERSDGSDVRREERLDLCGIVHFVDADGDGLLGASDQIVRSDLVEFGPIRHRLGAGVHIFETTSVEANLNVTLRIPAAFPDPDVPLIDWEAVASPACEPGATHFAIKLEQEEPSDFDRFFAAECGTTLVAPGDASPPPPSPTPTAFECENLADGSRFETTLVQEDGGLKRLETRVEADTRVRAEVRFETDDSGLDVRREVRIELCGTLQFSDEDGDGAFGANDTVVSGTLLEFGAIGHTIEGDLHVFRTTSLDGNMTVTIRVPATFPAADQSLVEWSVTANPTCDPGATHYAVKLEREMPTQTDEFFVAACGTILSAAGEV